MKSEAIGTIFIALVAMIGMIGVCDAAPNGRMSTNIAIQSTYHPWRGNGKNDH